MLKRMFLVSIAFICFLGLLSLETLHAQTGIIKGTVRDAQSGEPLPSASLVLVGTSLGTAADIDGRYVIRNIAAGSYTLKVSYIGYEGIELPVALKADEDLVKDIKLVAVGVQGEVVVVTAQAQGQNEAINKQLASVSILNVVSASRIQELPDANAAESVGRLPGVSILRSGGEGNQVVVRGLQPKYNAITVDGVRMSSTSATDRSVDLSMISSNMLEGIEVMKTILPDQDPDVLGGTVNFKMREPGAGGEEHEGLGVSLLAQGGYNGLSNAPNKYNNYKYVAGLEGRLFEDRRFGLFVQLDLERRNLTSNEFGAAYDQLGGSTTDYKTVSLNLNDIPRDRRRANGTIVLDYRLPDGKVTLINFVSTGATEIHNRGETFDIQSNQHSYSLGYSKSTLNLITNSLAVDQQISFVHASLKLSHTYSETNAPEDWSVSFLQTSAGIGQFVNMANLNPQEIPRAANNNFAQTFLNACVNSNRFSAERAKTASLDLELPINLSDLVTSVVKFGGKYRHQTRSYTYEQFNNNASFSSPSARIAAQMIASLFPSTAALDPSTLPITAYADPNFDYGEFLHGDYQMVSPLNEGMMMRMAHFLRDNALSIMQQQAEGYARNTFLSTTNNYSGFEDQSAGYLMATIKLGQELTVIPGVRYQSVGTNYSGVRGIQSSLSYYDYNHIDTTVEVNHSYWLPALIVRYQPFSWFDIRLSYTNTLAYPDYNSLIPRIDVATSSIAWNNYKIEPSRCANYDLYLSFHDNAIGLFTVGGFLKQIDNLIYGWTFYVSGAEALQYYPQSLTANPPGGNYSINTFVNDKYRINNWGMEIDWQTHLWYLPEPLNGLVLNTNFTHIFSEAQYPFIYLYKASLRSPVIPIDTAFTARLLFQPRDIVNISVGYDYLGFSVRLSMLYQTDIFTGPNFWPQLRTNTSAYRRWDLSLKQALPWFGIQVFADFNNINGANDISVIQGGGVPQSEQSYGMTANIGLRWHL